MFAQLIITCILVWTVVEALCRLVLRQSSFAVVSYLLTWRPDWSAVPLPRMGATVPGAQVPAQEPSKGSLLRSALRERRRQLAAAEAELQLKRSTAEVAEQLVQAEQDLARVEERLAGASLSGTA